MSFLHSKKLVLASMLLREQHRKMTQRLHPKFVDKLVRITKEP